MLMPARITHHAFGAQNFGSNFEIKNNIRNEKDPKKLKEAEDIADFVVWHPMSEEVSASGKIDKNQNLRTKIFVPCKKSIFCNNMPVQLIDDALNVITQDFYTLPDKGLWNLFILNGVTAQNGSSATELDFCGCIAKAKPNAVSDDKVLASFPIIDVGKDDHKQMLSGTFSFYTVTDGLFSLSSSEDNGTQKITVSNNYYQVCGRTYQKSNRTMTADDGILSLEISTTSPATASFRIDSDMNYLQTAQEDLSKIVVPLYKIDDGAMSLDMRNMPKVGILESIQPAAS